MHLGTKILILIGSILWAVPANAACYSAEMQAIAQQCANQLARLDQKLNFQHCGPSLGPRSENIAIAKTEAGAMHLWRTSKKGHAEILRLPGCRGVASAVGRSGWRYWAMEIQ